MGETIALIPARGGSMRIPRKNIRNFAGRPMIAWPIETARLSKLFDRVIVSTDDQEIAELSRQEGAEIPFIRPKELSDDITGVSSVVKHAILKLQESGLVISDICLIYATAPFLQVNTLVEGQNSLHSENCDFALAVTTYAFPIQRAVKKTNYRRLAMFQPEHYESRSQDLEPAYHDAAQFCWGTIEAWLEERFVYGSNTVPIVLPRHLVQDIDDKEDWRAAEWKFKAMQKYGNN